MTENHRTGAHSILSNKPVLFIPLDSSRHNRTYSFTSGEYPLDERLNRSDQTITIKERRKNSSIRCCIFLIDLPSLRRKRNDD